MAEGCASSAECRLAAGGESEAAPADGAGARARRPAWRGAQSETARMQPMMMARSGRSGTRTMSRGGPCEAGGWTVRVPCARVVLPLNRSTRSALRWLGLLQLQVGRRRWEWTSSALVSLLQRQSASGEEAGRGRGAPGTLGAAVRLSSRSTRTPASHQLLQCHRGDVLRTVAPEPLPSRNPFLSFGPPSTAHVIMGSSVRTIVD